MTEVVNYDDIIKMLDFLGIKYIVVNHPYTSDSTIVAFKGEYNNHIQVHVRNEECG